MSWRVLCILPLLIAAHAAGGIVQFQASEALTSVTQAVPDANIVLIIDDAAGQRQSGAGRSMLTALTGIGFIEREGELAHAWADLAGAIGLEGVETFDQLLGTRAIFVSEDFTLADRGRWAVATVVPNELALTVLKKLDATGRNLEFGQTVFAIEDGAFQIALVRPVNKQAGQGDSRVLVFAPRSSSKLRTALVKKLSEAHGWDELVGGRRQNSKQIACVLRAERSDVATITVLHTKTGWRGQAFVETPAVEQQTPGWSGHEFKQLSAGSWLSLADEFDLATLFSSPFGALVPMDEPLLGELDQTTTDRVYLSIRPAKNGVSIMLAIETDNSALATQTADTMMQRVVTFLTGSPDTSPDFLGFMPTATRSVSLRGHLSQNLLEPMLGKAPTASWQIPNQNGSNWLVLRLGPASEHAGTALRALAHHLPEADEGGRNSSIGVAKPGYLGWLVERAMPESPPLGEHLSSIKTLGWSSRQRPGKKEITFDLLMSGTDD